MRVGFIGFGRMGQALVRGSLAARAFPSSSVVIYDLDRKVRDLAKRARVKAAGSLNALVDECRVIFLCVKPQDLGNLLKEIVSGHAAATLQNKCFVSIAAGVTLKQLERTLGRGVSVFRVMPNTPALIGLGMSGVARGRFVRSQDEKMVRQILSSVSELVMVPDGMMHAVTAVSGSGPAYVFYLAEALIEAAQKLGLSRSVATTLVNQTIRGAGCMLREQKISAKDLRRQVTSKGGTTEAALDWFAGHGFKSIVSQALARAKQRSQYLSQAKL